MRTTLTIDDDIDARLRLYAQRRNMRYKDAINEALRKGLERVEMCEGEPEFVVETADYGVAAGVDSGKLNQLYDELEQRSLPE